MVKEQVALYNYKTLNATEDRFEDRISNALNQVRDQKVVRLVIIERIYDNHIYEEKKKVVNSILLSFYGDNMPAWSFVAQPPLDCYTSIEFTLATSEMMVDYRLHEGIPYVNVSQGNYREIIVGGVSVSTSLSIEVQCKMIFDKVAALLKHENMEPCNIARQWNYIEKITAFEGECQHYQLLNDARSIFYATTKWANGYPAATGIGQSAGGIIVDFNCVDSSVTLIPLDNSLQIAAHEYSQHVLIGEALKEVQTRTTPKFERAKIVAGSNKGLVYISGTAAIRGESSLKDADAIKQTIITMENIDYLVGISNFAKVDLKKQGSDPDYKCFRIYIKNEEDIDDVKNYMESKYQNIPKCYLYADVCREELLVEIEGVSYAQYES